MSSDSVPEVSVILTTCRREHWLPEAIESARSQRGVTIEIVVVDDSPEGTARHVVESLGDPSVRYFHRAVPSEGRPGLVRNEAIALARAPLIHFLDDDDRLADGALEALAEALSTSNAGMAFGRVLPFGDDPKVTEHEAKYFDQVADAARRIRGRRWFAAHLMFLESFLVNSACMVRRDALEAEGGYDPSLRCCEDVELYVRIGRAYGTTFVDRNILHYRVGASSIMKEIREHGRHPSLIHTYRTMNERYQARYGVLEYRFLQLFTKAARRLSLT
jgi:glycosyltransferase involved in cell wall biosynthesis